MTTADEHGAARHDAGLTAGGPAARDLAGRGRAAGPGTDAGLLSPVWAGTDAADLVCDDAWLQAMLEVEVALARAQVRIGMIPAGAVGPISAAAKPGRLDLVDLAQRAREAANPVVALVAAFTAAVAEEDPAAAEYVHRGSTSQDIFDSAAMLVSSRVLVLIRADLDRTAHALAQLAQRYRDTPMAGRTLTQHAVPITFGLKAAGWLGLVLDARERVDRVLRTGLPAQLGGAAGTLSAYAEYARLGFDDPDGESSAGPASGAGATAGPPLRAVELIGPFAAELGLAEPVLPWHTARTPLVDLASALTVTTGALGKFALDVQGMSRTEVGEVAEPGPEGRGGSSAMPQKRNPVLATMLISAARQVPALAMIVAQSMLAEDERAPGGWQAEWQPLRECLRVTGGAARTAAELAEGLTVFPERLHANLELSGGTIVSERLNAVLAPLLGKVAAKKLLARISRQAAEGGASFADLLAGAPELAGAFPGEGGSDARKLLDPAGYLGASGPLVDRSLARFHALYSDAADTPSPGITSVDTPSADTPHGS